MSETPSIPPDEDPGTDGQTAEGATPADVGAVDGAAAAGSAAATGHDDGAPGDDLDDDGGFSTSPPDPTTGPD